ncbi:hypothetical protein RUND412_011511 [Rhizina undulata]
MDEKHFEKRVKKYVKLLKGKRLRPDLTWGDQQSFWAVHSPQRRASIGWDGRIKVAGMWLPSGSVIARGAMLPAPTEDRASARMLA